LNGNIEFVAKYTYKENGIVSTGEIIKSNNDTISQKFDTEGKLISK